MISFQNFPIENSTDYDIIQFVKAKIVDLESYASESADATLFNYNLSEFMKRYPYPFDEFGGI